MGHYFSDSDMLINVVQNPSRRKFFSSLVAGSAGLVAASCSSSAESPEIVALFSQDKAIVAGLPSQRIPFGVVETETSFVTDQSELAVSIKKDGVEVEALTVPAHIVEHDHVAAEADDGHQHAAVNRYFPLRANLPEPGVYDIEVDFGGEVVSLPVQAFAESDITGLVPGKKFPSFVTPTDGSLEAEANDAGVDRICTRDPQCWLHGVTPAELVGKKAFVLLVATPAFCSTAYCGPVLETMLGVQGDYRESIEFIHAEVYANIDEVGGNFANPAIELAPHMFDLRLDFEPAVYLVDSNGILVDKLDNVYDETELRSALDSLV